MRTILGLTLLAMLATAAHANDVSVACAMELVRREAIVESDYQTPSSPWTDCVSHDGQTVGTWSISQIKREMAIGRLPKEVYFHDADRATGWQWSAASKEFEPLSGDPALGADDLGARRTRMLTGCRVSDPVQEAANQETVWMFIPINAGQFLTSRGIRDLTTGEEGFWFSRSSTDLWAAQSRGGADITLCLPDMNYLDAQDDFSAHVIDCNTLSIHLPGPAATIFRRM